MKLNRHLFTQISQLGQPLGQSKSPNEPIFQMSSLLYFCENMHEDQSSCILCKNNSDVTHPILEIFK